MGTHNPEINLRLGMLPTIYERNPSLGCRRVHISHMTVHGTTSVGWQGRTYSFSPDSALAAFCITSVVRRSFTDIMPTNVVPFRLDCQDTNLAKSHLDCGLWGRDWEFGRHSTPQCVLACFTRQRGNMTESIPTRPKMLWATSCLDQRYISIDDTER